MDDLHPQTLEEHLGYLFDIVPLKLHWLHYSLTVEHPEESFQSAIRNRVDIYRKTAANPGPHTPKELFFDAKPWLDMENAANEIFKHYNTPDDAARDAFEKEAFEVFRASLEERNEKDFLDDSVIANYQCGSLKHELQLDSEGYLSFHIANALRPHSIFDDPLYLPRCFRALLRVARHYGAKGLRCGTWLNENKIWLSYFPKEWLDNMGPACTNVSWGYGFWGQFINARGTYAKKTGDYLRQNHKFRYYPRSSFMSLKTMEEHVSNILDTPF